MVFDAHAHIIVPEMCRSSANQEEWRPRVHWEGGRQIVEHRGRSIASAVREFVDIDVILKEMDADGTDRVLLCPWVTLLGYDLELEEATRACRIQNQALAALVRANPERVGALGTVPLQSPEDAARNLEELMASGDLGGVEVAASVRGACLGEERFLPFWRAAEDTGAVVFIHPTTRGFDLSGLSGHYMWNTVGNPLETTITAAQMVMAGVMEAHPGLKVVLAHGGGAVMCVRGRLRWAHTFQPEARSRLQEPPDDSLRRFYYDTVTHDRELLRALVDYAGADHVLLGSDYPFDMGVRRPADGVRELGLAPEQEAGILGGNVARLLAGVPSGSSQTEPEVAERQRREA